MQACYTYNSFFFWGGGVLTPPFGSQSAYSELRLQGIGAGYMYNSFLGWSYSLLGIQSAYSELRLQDMKACYMYNSFLGCSYSAFREIVSIFWASSTVYESVVYMYKIFFLGWSVRNTDSIFWASTIGHSSGFYV